MIKRITTIAWTVVFVALFVELLIGARTTFDVIHPRPATLTPTEPTPTRALPTSTPVGWRQYTSTRLGLTLFYPDTWSPVPADSLNQTAVVDQFKGPDGFFTLDTLENSTVIDKLCDLTAHSNSQYFGVAMNTTREVIAKTPGCLIEPGTDNPPLRRSEALLESPWLDPSYNYITLVTDPEHFERIVESLVFVNAPVIFNTPTPGPIATPLPTDQLPTPVLSSSQYSGMTMDEYAVVSALTDTPNHTGFNDRIPAAVFANHQALRNPDLNQHLVAVDALIRPLGWHFDPDANGGGFNVFQNNTLVKSSLQHFSPIQVNSAGTDFKTVVTDASGATWLVQANGLAPWDASLHFNAPPVFAGNDVVSVDADPNKPSQLTVTRAGAVAFTLNRDPGTIGGTAVILGSLGSQWILNVDGQLFQDGKLANRSLGYTEIFNWQLLNGKPFYFFMQSGLAGVSYNNVALPLSYAQVVHNAAGDSALFNPQGNNGIVWFYASHGGTWYYVEITSSK